jgi:hypothetical protein
MSALTSGQGAGWPDYGLTIFVQPRCLASRRLMTLVGSRLDAAECEVPLILAVTGERDEARRLAATCSVRCRLAHVPSDELPEEIRRSVPCAVVLTKGRLVRHAGSMRDEAAVTSFIEACGDMRLRQWFNGLPT